MDDDNWERLLLTCDTEVAVASWERLLCTCETVVINWERSLWTCNTVIASWELFSETTAPRRESWASCVCPCDNVSKFGYRIVFRHYSVFDKFLIQPLLLLRLNYESLEWLKIMDFRPDLPGTRLFWNTVYIVQKISYPSHTHFSFIIMFMTSLLDLSAYLSRCCVPFAAVPGRSQLCSADERHLLLPKTSTVTLVPRAFCSSGPASWNSLILRQSTPGLDTQRLQAAAKCMSIYADVGLHVGGPWTCSPRAPIVTYLR